MRRRLIQNRPEDRPRDADDGILDCAPPRFRALRLPSAYHDEHSEPNGGQTRTQDSRCFANKIRHLVDGGRTRARTLDPLIKPLKVRPLGTRVKLGAFPVRLSMRAWPRPRFGERRPQAFWRRLGRNDNSRERKNLLRQRCDAHRSLLQFQLKSLQLREESFLLASTPYMTAAQTAEAQRMASEWKPGKG
jgi:hypothetical protein